jgi:protein-S-isoprenylcysteine O-methyltransferase Ste14
VPLDAVRFGWSEEPGWLQILGAVGLVLSFYIIFLTFRENAYLAPVVKLQQERGQSVVSTGPYRYVRHPICASMFLFFPATALLLGSWWGLLLCPVFWGYSSGGPPSRTGCYRTDRPDTTSTHVT